MDLIDEMKTFELLFPNSIFFYHNAGFIAKMKNIENNYSLINTVCNFLFDAMLYQFNSFLFLVRFEKFFVSFRVENVIS